MTKPQRQSSGDIAVYERPDRFDIYRFEADESRDLFERFVASAFTRDEALQKARELADDRTVFWRDVSGVVTTIE